MNWNPSEAQLLCRDLQHSWIPLDAFLKFNVYERTLRCVRCDSRKIQELDMLGFIVSSRMQYPVGYLRPEGRMSRNDRAKLRLENL